MIGDSTRTFRLPPLTYLAVLFLLFGVTPMVQSPALAIVYLVPVLAAIFIARVATVIDRDGIRVRAAFGSRALPWTTVRGVSVGGRNVYAVTSDGTYRLPCVRINDLPAIARVSDGRLPSLPDPTPKFAKPARRRRG